MTDQKFNRLSILEKCKELDPGLYNAIQVIQAPFLPAKRNNQFLATGQNILLEALEYNWQIIACWIICLQTGKKLNPKNSTYNLPEFEDRETWAQVLNAQLKLCAGVQEFKPNHKKYPTHYERWIACMQEIREWQVKSIIECPTRQPYPVYLIVRDCERKMYWKNATEYLTKHPNQKTRMSFLMKMK
ncbi:hypothetical protein [Cylindrospermum sp. FACHB-282]|uniref:hypothetical protein n=1 Tax=Cylindrospermum sp. FACHB-282 TaxID=2692794 RepID=UPI001685E794|nr:hypothetical protein [Cylindrospermum sp. FACHB-282]MBD2385171.1 hypothetical protein [Cylindrospermum sp. FACHB-282]